MGSTLILKYKDYKLEIRNIDSTFFVLLDLDHGIYSPYVSLTEGKQIILTRVNTNKNKKE